MVGLPVILIFVILTSTWSPRTLDNKGSSEIQNPERKRLLVGRSWVLVPMLAKCKFTIDLFKHFYIKNVRCKMYKLCIRKMYFKFK